MNKKTIIYGLYSSRKPDELRYIGQTITKFSYRMYQHISASRKPKLPVNFWMQREIADGFEVFHRILCDNALFNTTEQELISFHNSNGAKLLNLTAGGGGQYGFKQSDEHVEKRASAHRGIKHTEEAKAKMRAAKIGRILPEEHKKNISKTLSGRSLTEEHKAKISMAHIGKLHKPVSDETKRKISNFHLGRKKSDEHKLKISKAHLGKPKSNEHRAAMSRGWAEKRLHG